MNSAVRVRFAPSPTGFFHIGGARTALFNWLYARHCGGTFILRIEDTDKKRDSEESVRVLIDGLKWLGLHWDEGPELSGPHGPYFQSERQCIYDNYLNRLRDYGRAYDQDGAVWFKVSGKPAVIHDEIRGEVTRLEEKDFVIVRSDGSPVFHFVNVVDDIDMAITHVIRGEDHLSNSSKHVEIFQALNVATPIFAHIPLILKTVGSGKMSKRDQGALVEDYKARWFLPEAVRNYLCLLGWSPKDDREILPIEEIIALFDLKQISKNNARFDEKKLAHVNGEYLRKLPAKAFIDFCTPALKCAGLISPKTDSSHLENVLTACQEKVRDVESLPNFCTHFFTNDFPVDEKAREKIFKQGNPLVCIREFLGALSSLRDFTEEDLETMVTKLAQSNNCKTGDYIHPIRFAVSGQSVGIGFYRLLCILGKDEVIKRLEKFLQTTSFA
ncbi:MAG: glutamate--tRNA ligase [Puniceicoccales bacterium]|jgi:glutamyl-tRNA synthetase|nr:glutamate--tRNA ligase [Puniceicoccales bacterium]